jgi:NAD(P)H-quinone oxidoreductase subunit 6
MDNISNGMKLVLLGAEIMTVLCAVVVAFHPNILYGSIFLLFSFLGIAVMFLYAGADFLAGAHVIIYVGGVTILVLFAIMLTQWLYQMKLRDVRDKLAIPVVLVAVGFAPFLFGALSQLAKSIEKTPPQNFTAFAFAPKTQAIGEALLGTYLLPFEGITILLLGALVGAVWLARPE